ncbi:hypothetical protein JCM17823_04610 [Halorubrum gandharaense]
MLDVYMERFEHPYLLSLVPLAGLLFVCGMLVEILFVAGMVTVIEGADLVAGFFGLFMAVLLIICSLGYFALYTMKFSTDAIHRWRVRDSEA